MGDYIQGLLNYMGKNDVVKNCQSNSHLQQAKALKGQPKLSLQAHLEDDLQRTEAELHLAVLTAIVPIFP